LLSSDTLSMKIACYEKKISNLLYLRETKSKDNKSEDYMK